MMLQASDTILARGAACALIPIKPGSYSSTPVERAINIRAASVNDVEPPYWNGTHRVAFRRLA